MVKIAIDMMGGDDAPQIVLDAVQQAIKDFQDLEIILFGDEKQYTLNHERIEFRHCTEEIAMDDEPVRAIKRKKDSSMVRMAEAVKHGEAAGCVSAGNTGALMSSGLFIVGRIKGVARPALVVTLPTIQAKVSSLWMWVRTPMRKRNIYYNMPNLAIFMLRNLEVFTIRPLVC